MNIESICWLYRINFGGVETRAKAISSYLAKEHNVEMLYAKTFFTRKEGSNPFTEKGLFILRNPYRDKKRGKRWWEEYFLKTATKYVKKHRHNIDLVDGLGINSIPGINARLPTIATIHGVDRWIKNPPKLEENVLEQADILVTITNHVRRQLIKSGVDRDKVHTIYNGIPYDSINNTKKDFSDLSKKYRLNSNMNVVLSVHNFAPKKNYRRILQSYTELKKIEKDCQLIFIGAGPLKKEAELFVKTNKFKDVHFLGHLPANEVYKFYKASKVFILPSTEGESWGIVFLEAMAAGCPVITSSLCGITEVIEHKKHAWIVEDPYDQAEITDALLNLYQNSELKKKLFHFGKKLAKEFDWTASGKKYNAIINSIYD